MITPIEKINGVYFKREDYYTLYGLHGAKVRGANFLIQKGVKEGYTRFTTVGHRKSPQIHIVGTLCREYGYDFVGHTPQGELPAAFSMFKVQQHKAGYNNVLSARCREFAKKEGYYEIPFGMETMEVVKLTEMQIPNEFPKGVKRIVVPVGSAVNLSGIIRGCIKNKIKIPIIGVIVGKSPLKTLHTFAWGARGVDLTLVNAYEKYAENAKVTNYCGVELDPIYEAKCLPFIKKGDLFWIVGIRTF